MQHKTFTAGFSTNKFVEKCFTDQAANSKKWVAASKIPHDDWKNNFPDKRGKFGKYPK